MQEIIGDGQVNSVDEDKQISHMRQIEPAIPLLAISDDIEESIGDYPESLMDGTDVEIGCDRSDKFTHYQQESSAWRHAQYSIPGFNQIQHQRLYDKDYEIPQMHQNNDLLFNRASSTTYPWFAYARVLLLSSIHGRGIGAKQARLTWLEALKHIAFFNDFAFIIRVWFIAWSSQHDSNFGWFTLTWLIATWIVQFCCYMLRGLVTNHIIDIDDSALFTPIRVFLQIRQTGEKNPEALCSFEQVFVTYTLVNRIIGEIPQVITTAAFLIHYGRDGYALLNITVSSLTLLVTTLRMGIKYPFSGTLPLFISGGGQFGLSARKAATTNRHMALFMSGVCAIWTITNVISQTFAHPLWGAVLCLFAIVSTAVSLALFALWIYLMVQGTVNIDHRFLLSESSSKNLIG